MKVAFRQYALSIAVFAIVLGGLVSVDERVRDRFVAVVQAATRCRHGAIASAISAAPS